MSKNQFRSNRTKLFIKHLKKVHQDYLPFKQKWNLRWSLVNDKLGRQPKMYVET
jgi:hypothetical protein